MDDKIPMPPLPNEPQTNQQPADNYIEEEPVHQLPDELKQAQALQKEAEEQSQQQSDQKETIQEEPLTRRIADKPTPQESFNELKRAKTRAERERDEALERLRIYESQKAKEPEEDFNVNIAPDEYAEGKHLQKLAKEVTKLKQQNIEAQKRAYELAAEARLKIQYPDIDRVLSSENIAILRERHPELAKTLHYNPDFYDKAVATYEMIKAKGIAGETELQAFNENKIKTNLAKPRTLATLPQQKADSPINRVNAFSEGLTPELEKALRKEMAESIRNR